MKKKVHTNPIKKYSKLFKFLSFDQSLFSSLFITIIILVYAFAILGLFLLLYIPLQPSRSTLS